MQWLWKTSTITVRDFNICTSVALDETISGNPFLYIENILYNAEI